MIEHDTFKIRNLQGWWRRIATWEGFSR